MKTSNSIKAVLLIIGSTVALHSCQFLTKVEKTGSSIVNLSGAGLAGTLLDQGCYQQAIELCNQLIKKDPKCDGMVYLLRAQAYNRIGDYQKAVDDCTEAIRLNPENYIGSGCYLRSQIYRKWGKEQLAANDFLTAMKDRIKWTSKYISDNLKLSDSYISRAAAYACIGQSQKSIDDCNKAENILFEEAEGETDSVYVNRAFAYLEQKKYANALHDLNKAITLCPKDGEPYYWRAKVYTGLGQQGKAGADLKKAKEFGPAIRDQYEDRVFAFHYLASAKGSEN